MNFNRRRFLQAFGAAAAISATPGIARANTSAHVVVVGGGFGGATVAKYLRLWSNWEIDVTLVDPRVSHTSCVLSNLVLNGRISMRELERSYGSLSSFYGINVVQDLVTEIGAGGNSVKLKGGGSLSCDYLVLATGISFRKPEGIDFEQTPHAWIAGPQTRLLTSQVNSIPSGGSFVMSIPKSPYRCPPGPYERACIVADILKRNGGGRVTVLDANTSIQAERHTFERAFNSLYGDIIRYVPSASVSGVDSENRVVETSRGNFQGDVVNIIPPQQAPWFIRKVGLTEGGKGWTPVDPLTYASTVPGFKNVHIIGDAQGTNQPKSAHMANAQAKVCADAIIRLSNGLSTHTDERIRNITTNSACYSPINRDEASWLTANYAYDLKTGRMELAHLGEAEGWSRENYGEMFAWASNLFTDSFS